MFLCCYLYEFPNVIFAGSLKLQAALNESNNQMHVLAIMLHVPIKCVISTSTMKGDNHICRDMIC